MKLTSSFSKAMRAVRDETSHVLHVVEISTTTTMIENRGAAIVKVPPTKENPIAISKGRL